MGRLLRDEYFMLQAFTASLRSTCRAAHGCVVTLNSNVMATGYNGAPHGMPHCLDHGCLMKQVGERERCVRTVHAEANALQKGNGDTLYTTGFSCFGCLKMALQSSVERILWYDHYSDFMRDDYLREVGYVFEEEEDRGYENWVIPRSKSVPLFIVRFRERDRIDPLIQEMKRCWQLADLHSTTSTMNPSGTS